MSEEIRGYTKEEFLSLILNQLKTEEDKETFYQKMLLGLHENAPVLQSEEDGPEGSTTPSDVLKNIFNNIDWKMLTGTEYGEDEFFNGQEGLYTSLGEELKRIFEAEGNDYKKKDLTGEGQSAWWTNSYWNESIAKLLQILAQRIDPNNIMTYEKSGLLIELIPDQKNPNVEEMIDTEHLRAGLIASKDGTPAKAALRMIDIMDADAGNSFEGDKDTYWYGDYYDSLTLTYTDANKKEHPTILTKVLFKENADTILAKIRNEEEITVADFKKLIKLDTTEDKTDDSACIYSGIINADLEDIGTSNILIILTEGGDKYRFKVVKNPWVIPWYNFDGETYSRVRGDDKHVSALTDKNKLDFTRLDEDEMISSIGFKQQAKHVYDIIEAYKEEREKLINPPSSISFIPYESAIEPIGSIDMNNRQYLKEESFPPDTLDAGYYYWPLSDFQTDDSDFYITIACSRLKQTIGLYPEQLTDEYCEQYCKEIVQQAIDSLGGDVSHLPSVNVSNAIAAQEDPDGIIINGYKSHRAYVNTYDDIPYQFKQFLYMLGKCGSIEILKKKIEKLADKYGVDYSDLVPTDTKKKVEIIDEDSFVQLYATKAHHWIRLLMPRYKRKVEIEDLNRNFWVIGQVLAGICADLFDDEGPIGGMIKGLLKEIAQLWENVVYLWAALALLSQKRFYGVTHSEVVMLPVETFLPYLTYDNFANGDFNPLVVIPKLEYLTRMYPEQNLMILPGIRLNNYEKNYYGEICIPGVYAYDRNDETWSVFSFECSTSQNFIQSGKLDFILLDYQDNIYGISEEEEKYKYLAPLSSATNVHSSEDTRFYGIARDKIDFGGQLYKYNPIVEGQENRPTWESNIQVNLHLELHDLAAEFVTKEERKIISFDGAYNDDTIKLSNVINVYGSEPLEKIEPDYIRIEKGYYQGELLSTCLDALRRILNIVVLPAAQLTPVFEDQTTLVNNYSTPMYEALRQQDSQLLEALLKLIFEYNLNGAESFWNNHDAEDIFTIPENYFGTWNAGATALEGKKTRELAPYSRYDFTNYPSNYKKYYDETKKSLEDGLAKWKDNMRKRLTDKKEGTTINNDSILFITGCRDYSYPNASGETQPGITCDEYLPYNSSNEYKGFLAPIFAPIRGRSTVETGSALMFKIDDENYAYGFYKEHNSITGFSDGDETQQYKKLSGISNPFIWSEFIERNGETLPTWGYRTNPSDPWDWTIPIRDLINNDTNANYIATTAGGGATGVDQYLVMREDGQSTFTEDNWRVVRLHSFAVEPHLLHENSGTYTTRNDLQRYYYSVSKDVYILIYEGLLRKYADELYVGGMTGIKSMGNALKAYFSDIDGTAGIKQDTYYQSASAEEKQKIDAMVAYFDNQYNTFKIGIEEHYYFYYQATLHGKYPPLYQEQCWIYNHLNGSDWSTEISDIYSEFDKEAYHTSSFGLKDPEGNTFSDRYFINGNVATDLGIYVFGPQENGEYLYARRAVRRAYDMDNNHPIFIDEVNEVGNVDDLKRGFTVVSATNNTIELEKYKTKHNGKYQSDYYNNTPGEFPDDNFPYNTEWDPDYIDYE